MSPRPPLSRIALLLGALAFTACDRTPLDPGLDAFDAPPDVALDTELVLATEPALAEVTLASAEAQLRRVQGAQVRARLRAAREHFEQARRRWNAGNADDARREGRRAREAVADALLLGLGRGSVEAMIDDVEALFLQVAVEGSGYDDPPALAATLAPLVNQARAAVAQGADRDAGEAMVRARQHVHRAGRRADGMARRAHDLFERTDRARVQVAMGSEAIALAERLIPTPTDTQTRLLDTARELQRLAEAALGQGEWGRAATLAREAEVTALRAVLDVDGVGHDEAQQIADLAEALLAEARSTVGADASALDRALLELAGRLFAAGTETLAQGQPRGLVLLWSSAAASSVLLP
ncbi:MAG: hypothetical protein R3E98_10070 [Gemmatimonadota bacterium]